MFGTSFSSHFMNNCITGKDENNSRQQSTPTSRKCRRRKPCTTRTSPAYGRCCLFQYFSPSPPGVVTEPWVGNPAALAGQWGRLCWVSSCDNQHSLLPFPRVVLISQWVILTARRLQVIFFTVTQHSFCHFFFSLLSFLKNPEHTAILMTGSSGPHVLSIIASDGFI